MQKAILFFTLIMFTILANAQVKPPLVAGDFDDGINPFEEIRLFDLAEIKARKIDTIYIIYHPSSWGYVDIDSNICANSYNDTLTRYVVDTQGRIIEKTNLNNVLGYSNTFHFDSLGNQIAMTTYNRLAPHQGYSTVRFDGPPDTLKYKRKFIRNKIGEDSLITIIHFMKLKKGMDTVVIEKKRYNSNGRLIEDQSSVNKKNKAELEDDTGSYTYHFEYNYDALGRLIYYKDHRIQEYQKISYPFYGKLTKTFDATTNKLKTQRIKLIKENKGIITITSDGKQTILTPLEKGSKLFKLEAFVKSDEFPFIQYNEIVYKSKLSIQ